MALKKIEEKSSSICKSILDGTKIFNNPRKKEILLKLSFLKLGFLTQTNYFSKKLSKLIVKTIGRFDRRQFVLAYPSSVSPSLPQTAEILANNISQQLHLPIIRLKKIKRFDNYALILSAAKRPKAIIKFYALAGPADKKKIQGKEIILIDDILITGSIAKEVSQMLIKAGAKKIHLFVVADLGKKRIVWESIINHLALESYPQIVAKNINLSRPVTATLLRVLANCPRQLDRLLKFLTPAGRQGLYLLADHHYNISRQTGRLTRGEKVLISRLRQVAKS
ncbi:MAG: phosphoribosyltransferase family protein [Patescibacteria group bacterium]